MDVTSMLNFATIDIEQLNSYLPNRYQIGPCGPSACGEQAVRTQESGVGPSLLVCTEMRMAGERGPPNSPLERDMTGPRRSLPKSKAKPVGMPSLDTLG